MVIAEPGWLHTLGQIAGTLLLLELVLVLFVVMALMIAIMLGARWLHMNVVPVVDQYGDKAIQALGIAQRSGDRVAQGVASFHGRVEGVQATIRTLFFGKRTTDADLLPSADQDAALPSPEAALNAEALTEHLNHDGAGSSNGHIPRATGYVG